MTYVKTPAEKRKYKEFLEKTGKEELAAELYLQWKALTDLYFLGAVILGMDKIEDGGRPRLDPVLHGWLSGIMERNDDTLYSYSARTHEISLDEGEDRPTYSAESEYPYRAILAYIEPR